MLVVNDADARQLTRRGLEECGAAVTLAPSARYAFDALQADVPAVIFSDIGMPEMDGYEFIKVSVPRTASTKRLRGIARSPDEQLSCTESG